MTKKKKIAIVGTNGIPAQYGGFETLVENLTLSLSNEYQFVIYCSKNQKTRIKTHNNSTLKYIPLRANGWQSIFYDSISLFLGVISCDAILYLGPGAGFIMPFINLFGKKTIINHGGLNEWERTKYTKFERFVAKAGHSIGAKFASCNITDNNLLRDSIKRSFGQESIVIRYGGDHTSLIKPNNELRSKYPFLSGEYFVNVSRAQIDNNLHIVLNAFTKMSTKKIVMISNWQVSEYGQKLKREYYGKYENIILLDAIYDKTILDTIRGNAHAYIHSHSYCGTSPSLVEAMSLGLPIICYDIPTNHETTHNKAIYFSSSDELISQIMELDEDSLTLLRNTMKQIATDHYTWSHICSLYSNVFMNPNQQSL